jgi:hypothetical protein
MLFVQLWITIKKMHMKRADTCVLVLPCGRSAHLEAGWFCGASKRCIVLLAEHNEPELMNLLATDICLSIDEVISTLGGYDYVTPMAPLVYAEGEQSK